MVDLVRMAGETYVGGLYVNKDITHIVEAGAVIRFDWSKLQPAELTRLHNAIRRGFGTTTEGSVPSLLKIFRGLKDCPPHPEIGYFGKKNMNVLVLSHKAEQYRTDLIAAGHMVDVDLSGAARVAVSDDPRWKWINVTGYNVRQMGGKEDKTPSWSRKRSGAHLKPATSKLTQVVCNWTAELYPEREALLDWIASRPPITFTFKSNL